MTKSPTVHNPTNFDPAVYEVENYLDNQRPTYFGQAIGAFEQEVQFWEAEMLSTFGQSWRSKIHHCAHCGNGRVRWITAVRYAPTGEVVVFGSDCTARLGFKDRHAFKLAQLQARAEARKVRFTIYNQRQKFLADHPEVATALAQIENDVHAKNWFVKDVLSKLDRFGSLSDRQVSAVTASLKRDVDFAAAKAATTVEIKGDAPSGRTTVTGTVLSFKEVESAYGYTTKMMVKLTNGDRVWVTRPGKETIERGDDITLTATWTVSDKDRSFAFGKRPSLVSRVSAASAAGASAPNTYDVNRAPAAVPVTSKVQEVTF